MDIAQKALYNSLRMSFLQNPESHEDIAIEPWKIEDYRTLTLDELFKRLYGQEIILDKQLFKSYAEQFDSPEELTQWLLGSEEILPEEYDQVYLVIFELWRKLTPEKPSISIICDELDFQIGQYDLGKRENPEPLQEALSTFYAILQENIDQGMEPTDVFVTLSEFLAHDLEHFLYDYISDQIDEHAYDVATELLDQFYPFIGDKKWFDLLRARLISLQDIHTGNEILKQIFEESKANPQLDFYLDMISSMVQEGDHELFQKIAHEASSTIEHEEDFLELLTICSDFYGCLDKDDIQEKLEALIQKRKQDMHFGEVSASDPDLLYLKTLLKKSV